MASTTDPQQAAADRAEFNRLFAALPQGSKVVWVDSNNRARFGARLHKLLFGAPGTIIAVVEWTGEDGQTYRAYPTADRVGLCDW